MNLSVFYPLIGAEIGLVVAIGTVAARRALRRQEIKHSAMMLEHIEPMLQIVSEQSVPLVVAQIETERAEPGDDDIEAVPLRVSPHVETEKFDAAAGAKWVAEARKCAISIFMGKGEVTSDDVWQACPPPPSVDGRLTSQVLSRSDWQIVGYRHSVRGRNAARQIAVWRLKQRDAA